jgi:tRNA(Ile)-lysidine synthase
VPPARRPPEVARVLQRVTAAVRRHQLFEPGQTVVVACSGGPDSICLLHALWRLRRLLRIDLVCFHFDHRLREGSDRDVGYVRRQAAGLGVPFAMRTAESKPARGQSVEAWARTVRYRSLEEVMEERGAAVAAVGHTLDDQAETVLMAALRGGGTEALAAMRPRSDRIVRPLLEVRREETVAFCRALSLRPRRDPMNDDPSYLRVALRRNVIPAMERALGRGVREPLARTAALLRSDADWLEAIAAGAYADVASPPDDGEVRLRAADLTELPDAIASRVVRIAVRTLGAEPDASHVEAVRSLAAGRPGRRASLPGGLVSRRERGYVRVFRAGGPGADAGRVGNAGGRRVR